MAKEQQDETRGTVTGPGVSAATADVRDYWEQRLDRNPGYLGVGYTRLGTRYNDWLYRFRSEVFQQCLAEWRLARPEARVLDVGSGTGHYVREWLRAGVSGVTGSDLTEVAVARLSREFPQVRFVRMDVGAPALPEGLGTFDVVTAMDVLFHIVDDAAYARALRNVASVLPPGGHFVLSENFLRHGREGISHIVSRSKHEIERGLADAGFEIVDRTPMFVLMNYPTDTSGPLGWLARKAWTAMMLPAMVSEAAGDLLGRVLTPIERRLVRRMKEGPTTEIVLARRRR